MAILVRKTVLSTDLILWPTLTNVTKVHNLLLWELMTMGNGCLSSSMQQALRFTNFWDALGWANSAKLMCVPKRVYSSHFGVKSSYIST